MKDEISKLEPQKVWSNFEKICSIPHPSKHEGKIIEFVESTGKRLGLLTHVDEAGNIIIRKPATPGFEQFKMITLQSHLDMVPQKNSDTKHDFVLDPIRPVLDGDWVTAQGTTLGADNGIGVATTLAILESSDIEHGPIEALFTVDEETGMTGAFNLEQGLLEGEILINLDSEQEGELYIGCAGGVTTQATFHFEETEVPAFHEFYELSLSGFKGGHSGVDIHLERGNPNQEIARFLLELVNENEVHVCTINGGSLRNAIPREATAVIAVKNGYYQELKEMVKSFELTLKSERQSQGAGIRLELSKSQQNQSRIDHLELKNILKSIIASPNGVLEMNSEMPGVVEVSSNMGIVTTSSGCLTVNTLQRASHDTLRTLSAERIRHVFELAGAQVEHHGEYPGWVPEPDSEILGTMSSVYESMFHTKPIVLVIHAGLECGLIHSNYPQMEMISLGPTIKYPHSPDEKVNIASVEKFWIYLLQVLKSVPKRSGQD